LGGEFTSVMNLIRLGARYSISGLVNTVVGYAVIFSCMAFGLGPSLSNVLGYVVGFATSFAQARYWVFRSENRVADDIPRFVVAFIVAFAVNFLVLQVTLWLGANPYLAQLMACGAFVGIGFVLNYAFVFRKKAK
jgi:putative flippase GtrA